MCEKKLDKLKNLIEFYDHKIMFSLSTPVVKYSDNLFISVGHLKIKYKDIKSNTPFHKFVKSIDWSKINKHKTYIYVMFFYIYDLDYNIKYISKAFIPKKPDQSLQYMLVFPCGLMQEQDKDRYVISYGEGDESMKLFFISFSSIKKILYDIDDINTNYELGFMSDDFYIPDQSKNILVIGYDNEFNYGHNTSKIILKNLLDSYNLTFLPESNIGIIKSYEFVIVLDCNISQNWIVKLITNIKKKNDARIFGIFVDIDETTNNDSLKLYETIYMRDYNDISKYNDLYPELINTIPNINLLSKKFIDGDFPIELKLIPI